MARLFTSLATHDPMEDRYHITGSWVRPTTTTAPGAPGQGRRDNAYTNILAAWVCRRAWTC